MAEAAFPRFGAFSSEVAKTIPLLVLTPLRTNPFVALHPTMLIAKKHKSLTGSGIHIRQTSSFDGYVAK